MNCVPNYTTLLSSLKYVLTLILISFLAQAASAQFGKTIRTGRPGAAIGAYTVGKKVFQIQTGFNYNERELENVFGSNTWVFNSVFRYGIFEKLEVSGVVNIRSDEALTVTGTENQFGVSNTQIGLRYNILERKGAIPAIGLQGRLLLKAQSIDYQRENLGANLVLATGNKITDWLSLTTNWGIVWTGNGGDPNSLYAINASFSLTEKWGAFAEVFGSFNSFSSNYDAGFSYLVNNDLQLDASAGWQGQNGIVDIFIDFGLSWRLHNRE